jgi:hypothetical protein
MHALSIRGAPYAYARLNTVPYCRVPKKSKKLRYFMGLKMGLKKRPKKFVLNMNAQRTLRRDMNPKY